MIGEKVGSMQSQTTIKPGSAEDGRPVFEVSAQGGGTLCGAEVTSMASYVAKMQADGSLYGDALTRG